MPYLTLAPTDGNVIKPVVDVQAQLFRDHFSRFSSLIRDGLSFRLRMRASNEFVYARQHTGYQDPLMHVIEEWRTRVAEEAMAREWTRLSKDLKRLESNADELQHELKSIMRRVARLAIGRGASEEAMFAGEHEQTADKEA